MPEDIITDGGDDRAIHGWFGLSYSQYLTIPRLAMQEMPGAWQEKMVALLEELDATIDWRPEGGSYWVSLKGDDGRYRPDPLADYGHGRRHVKRFPPPGGEKEPPQHA